MTTLSKQKVELSIPSRAEFVAVARLTAAAIASRMNFAYDAIDDIKLAVGEACNNAIEHAYPGAEGEIRLSFSLGEDGVVIEIQDAGSGFDLAAQTVEDGAEPPERGLDLLLMRSVMDKVEVVSQAACGTRVTMTKHLADVSTEG